MASAIAASAIPAALSTASQAGMELAQTPVLGVHRRVRKVSRKKVVETDESLSIRAWEVGAVAAGAGILAWSAALYQSLTGQSLMSAILDTLSGHTPAPAPSSPITGTLKTLETTSLLGPLLGPFP